MYSLVAEAAVQGSWAGTVVAIVMMFVGIAMIIDYLTPKKPKGLNINHRSQTTIKPRD